MAAEVKTLPFWEQALLNLIGPAVLVIGGAFLATWLVNRATQRAQNGRADRELKSALIAEMMQAARGLQVLCGVYERAQRYRASGEWADPGGVSREEIDRRYAIMRRNGSMIEARLAAYFSDKRARTAWHAVIDCLSVRYFGVIGTPPGALRGIAASNAFGYEEGYHSGLCVEQLLDQDKLKSVPRTHLQNAVTLVLKSPLRSDLSPDGSREEIPSGVGLEGDFRYLGPKRTPEGG